MSTGKSPDTRAMISRCKKSYSNLTKGERNDLYLLRDDASIIIKEADKGSAVVV